MENPKSWNLWFKENPILISVILYSTLRLLQAELNKGAAGTRKSRSESEEILSPSA